MMMSYPLAIQDWIMSKGGIKKMPGAPWNVFWTLKAPERGRWVTRSARRIGSRSQLAVARSICSPPAPAGCTEAVMLAHGFTVEQIAELVRARLATATTRARGDGTAHEVARVKITKAGQRALADRR
jgi:hypothetical protein